jgi:hypothetical protein
MRQYLLINLGRWYLRSAFIIADFTIHNLRGVRGLRSSVYLPPWYELARGLCLGLTGHARGLIKGIVLELSTTFIVPLLALHSTSQLRGLDFKIQRCISSLSPYRPMTYGTLSSYKKLIPSLTWIQIVNTYSVITHTAEGMHKMKASHSICITT